MQSKHGSERTSGNLSVGNLVKIRVFKVNQSACKLRALTLKTDSIAEARFHAPENRCLADVVTAHPNKGLQPYIFQSDAL